MDALLRQPLPFLHRFSEEEACVGSFEDHRELVVVDPSFGPVDPRLSRCKPWVAQDHLLWTQFREEEPHFGLLFPCSGFKVGEEFDPAVFILGSVHVVNFSGGPESFKGDSQPPSVSFVDEIFGGP